MIMAVFVFRVSFLFVLSPAKSVGFFAVFSLVFFMAFLLEGVYSLA